MTIRGATNNAESVHQFQPRVCFETLGSKDPQEISRNSEGVASALRFANGGATLSELRLEEMNGSSPGLPKRNPGLELANAFSVVRRTFNDLPKLRIYSPLV